MKNISFVLLLTATQMQTSVCYSQNIFSRLRNHDNKTYDQRNSTAMNESSVTAGGNEMITRTGKNMYADSTASLTSGRSDARKRMLALARQNAEASLKKDSEPRVDSVVKPAPVTPSKATGKPVKSSTAPIPPKKVAKDPKPRPVTIAKKPGTTKPAAATPVRKKTPVKSPASQKVKKKPVAVVSKPAKKSSSKSVSVKKTPTQKKTLVKHRKGS
jgi:hypothetical protein